MVQETINSSGNLTTISFLLVAHLKNEIRFNPLKSDGFQLVLDEKNETSIKIKPAPANGTTEIDPWGNTPLICSIRSSRIVSPSSVRFVDGLIRGKYLVADEHTTTLPIFGNSGSILVDTDGNIAEGTLLSAKHFPEPIKSLCKEVYGELNETLHRFIGLLRWQQNISSPPDTLQYESSLYWNVSGENYHVIKLPQDAFIRNGSGGIRWTDANEFDFIGLWNKNKVSEPLAQELVREAYSHQYSFPRSAVLIAATALEVGVKSFITNIAPDTQWLISNIQSPPVHMLLRTYLPTLFTSKQDTLPTWDKLKPLFNRVQVLFDVRNALAHSGNTSKMENLDQNYIDDVYDLLCIFDVMNGHEWAKRHISLTVRTALGWEVKSNVDRDGLRLVVQISSND